MGLIKLLKYAVFIVIFYSCKSSKQASILQADSHQGKIVKEAFLNGFDSGLSVNGVPLWCEASAAVILDNQIWIAADKDMPDARSSVFKFPIKDLDIDANSKPHYLLNSVFKSAKKYEDFAITPNEKYVFLTTAFDRIKPGSAEWNGYNDLLYWKVGEENPVVYSTSGVDSSSISLRENITHCLANPKFPDGMPYFKIEGIAVTDSLFFWGVREQGKKFDDFNYQIKILSAAYHINNGKLQFGEITTMVDFDIQSINPGPWHIALSSIEYDRFNNRFILLTSFEDSGHLGGYLWTASLSDLKNRKLTLIKTVDGMPLLFDHKCEDVAILNKRRLIIIHDDDRNKTSIHGVQRLPHQAAYSIVDFQ